ncbi:hypothetical protein L1887_02949 [Cichorium endivia]|nr:hypothetical protein L1887_02949 [Cichorium endivia]
MPVWSPSLLSRTVAIATQHQIVTHRAAIDFQNKKKKKKAICDAIVLEKGQDVNQLFLKETIGFYFCRIMSNYTSGVF